MFEKFANDYMQAAALARDTGKLALSRDENSRDHLFGGSSKAGNWYCLRQLV